ncbi:type I secretion system permease/ATPase [Leisingera sp. McT4-56]|uniref:type I secretion system permease/ATPase n=1 Tax=Leisingera sp. McT4-56 TaxID=2881255 RepID=UPI001CF8EEBF|nr:type I secretion system permease/ATPase [Leisingera sp. McT4-56]MCB4457252.1 type I secretion system permease/ATPase [Leisingera sp. McT4-56]
MKVRQVFDGQRGVLAAIFTASIFVNLLILTAPLYMLQLFARVMASGSIPTLIALTTGAAIALVFFFLFDMIRQRLVARLGSRLEARLSPAVLGGMIGGRLPPALARAEPIRDIQELRGFVTSPLFLALLDAPWSLLFLALIFLFSPVLGLVALIGLMLLFSLGLISEMAARKPMDEATKQAAETNTAVAEMMNNASLIHAMGKTGPLIARWQVKAFSALVFNTLATDRVALMTSLAKAVRMGLQIAVLGVGVVLVINNQLSPGLMIAASILLGRAAAPVEQSIAGWRAFLKARSAHGRLNTFLAHLDEAPERLALPDPEGRLSVENATVVLPGRPEPLLLDISLELKPGQSLGLIGPSGAGKTTLAHALAGLQPLVRGHIRIDDAALTDWDPAQIGQHIGFLPQRVELFQGTVAENIALMDPGAKPSDVVAAAKLAQVHEMILALPGGYNSEVGPRGEFLSAGQRQRIGLARAFFGDRKLIILDEPNANLDPEGEEALATAIEAACARGAAVVAVTHRLSLLRRVSHAALLQEGRIMRFGEARQVIEAAAQPMAGSPARTGDPKIAPFRHRSPEDRGPDQEADSPGRQGTARRNEGARA